MSFWVSVKMPLANKTQMMLMNILMMTFAFSMKDEDDEDYVGIRNTKKISAR